MLDIAIAYDRYKFIGNEFLTWLWYAIDHAPDTLEKIDPAMQALEVGNRIVLKNQTDNGEETISIKGDTAGLEEGLLALAKGALVTEFNLIDKDGTADWKRLRESAPELFRKQVPPAGNAGNGAGQSGQRGADMNSLIRQAAGLSG